ncbi:BrnT family toxin [soil metagenome]
MKIEFDPSKNARNIEKHGISFMRAADLDWSTALFAPDKRYAYPETRFQVMAMLGERLHMLIITPIPDGIRVISFRKANDRERKVYAAPQDQRSSG